MYSLDAEVDDGLSLLNLGDQLGDHPGEDGRRSLVLGKTITREGTAESQYVDR